MSPEELHNKSIIKIWLKLFSTRGLDGGTSGYLPAELLSPDRVPTRPGLLCTTTRRTGARLDVERFLRGSGSRRGYVFWISRDLNRPDSM